MNCEERTGKVQELMQNEQLRSRQEREDIVLDDNGDERDKEKWSNLINIYGKEWIKLMPN